METTNSLKQINKTHSFTNFHALHLDSVATRTIFQNKLNRRGCGSKAKYTRAFQWIRHIPM